MESGKNNEQRQPSLDVASIEAEEQANSDKKRYSHHQVMDEARRKINRKER